MCTIPALVIAQNEILQQGCQDCEPNYYEQCTRTPQLVYKILSSPRF